MHDADPTKNYFKTIWKSGNAIYKQHLVPRLLVSSIMSVTQVTSYEKTQTFRVKYLSKVTKLSPTAGHRSS